MRDLVFIGTGILAPLLGTTLGAAAVIPRKKTLSARLSPALCGSAAGVMLAASFFSLLEPAIALANARGGAPLLPAATGFALGGFLFWLSDLLLAGREKREGGGRSDKKKRLSSLILAVTLHNLPEGMAVGVALAGALRGDGIARAGALALSLGIALQNVPEGAIISLPLRGAGQSRKKSFFAGFLSGTVEPAGAGLTLLFTALLTPVLPYVLCFAAGAMVYVVASELVPAWSGEGERAEGNFAFLAGFLVMMALDLALG